jgi:hypothetical protein
MKNTFQVNYTKLADHKTAVRDAERLFKAGEDRWGTDEETFNLIFATRDFYQLRAVYDQYVKVIILIINIFTSLNIMSK